MTGTWERLNEYRIVPDFPNYVLGPEMDLWSMPRAVRAKGGKTRTIAARQLKVCDGRVSLSQDGKTARFHVRNDLYPRVFPEMCERPNALCRKGHPLRTPVKPDYFGSPPPHCWSPRVMTWGSGNRICLHCSTPPTVTHDNMYSLAYGVAGAGEYSDLPARPVIAISGREFEMLEWDEHGFRIT